MHVEEHIAVWLTRVDHEVHRTLASLMGQAIFELGTLLSPPSINLEKLLAWVNFYPAQLCCVAMQVVWCKEISKALDKNAPLLEPLQRFQCIINVLVRHVQQKNIISLVSNTYFIVYAVYGAKFCLNAVAIIIIIQYVLIC